MENKNISSREFTSYDFSENLLKGVADAGYQFLTKVQEITFEQSLTGKDVTVMSQTGTGKTAAFLISIFSQMVNGEKVTEAERKQVKKALILSPTRELAIQIEKEAKLLGSHLGLLIGSFYGGVGYNRQELLLKKEVDVVVGTPGRILDFIQSKKLNLNNFHFLVIDEADRLFDMGFYPDVERIIRRMPPKEKRQTMMFSATLNNEARMIVRNFMTNPEKIEITPEEIVVKAISQTLFHVGSSEKFSLMLGLIKKESPKNILIFTNMKNEAIKISDRLSHNGFKSEYLIGDMKQNKRIKVIEDFKKNKLQILVATDVAARGLHIEDLEWVINYDLPNEAENYVHRIGRTARAGKSGKAISFGCEKFVYNLDSIEDFIGYKVPVEFAEDEIFTEEKVGYRDREVGRAKKKAPRQKSASKPKAAKVPSSSPKKKTSSKPDAKKSKPDAQKSKQAAKGEPKKTRPKNASKAEIQKKRKPKSKQKQSPKLETVEDRLNYYKKKYGEDFTVTEQKSASVTAKKGKPAKPEKKFIKRLLSVFRR